LDVVIKTCQILGDSAEALAAYLQIRRPESHCDPSIRALLEDVLRAVKPELLQNELSATKCAATGGWELPTSRTANLATRRCTILASLVTSLPQIATSSSRVTRLRPELNLKGRANCSRNSVLRARLAPALFERRRRHVKICDRRNS
jgi:hypothetical protein